MKLVIQIPCLNEQDTILTTLNALPKKILGVDKIEILIIDDGSVDDTVQIAKKWGVNKVVSHKRNLGLARAFCSGLNTALDMKADIIVNLDADNQYCADDIEKLIEPILNKKADIAIGTRPIDSIRHFSPTKKILQKLGSFVMKKVSGANVDDAPSGFRAFSSYAAKRINVFDNYTYTLETIIQAQRKGLNIACVPIRVNEDLRPSRLVKSNLSYIIRSIVTMLRIFIIYRPFRFFAFIGVLMLFLGAFLGFRFLYFYLTGCGQGHVQSLILCAILLILAFHCGLLAVISDLLAINRKLLEDIQFNLREKK